MHTGDADGEALVVGDCQNHRDENRRSKPKDIKLPRADRGELGEQQHRDQQRAECDGPGGVPHDLRLILPDVPTQHRRHQNNGSRKPQLGFERRRTEALHEGFLLGL